MAEGKIRVKFEPKGDKQLISAIKALRRETKKLAGANTVLTTETKKTNNEQKKQERRNRNLAGTFSVLRSKMLLGAFAVKQFADPFIALGRRSVMIAANFEALETRLVSMTGSTKIAAEMMTEFRDIAATTPFAVQDVVEAGVQLRAFGVNAQEMIKPVTDLAAFMGTTATEAASALGRAFAGGAGAADILRERGILQLIKDSQGIEDLSKITLPEFRRALESALIDPTAGIVGATDKLSKTTVGAFSNMQDALENFLAKSAEISGLKDSMTDLAEGTTELLNSTTSEKIERFSNLAKTVTKLAVVMGTAGAGLPVVFKSLGQNIEDFFTNPVAKAEKQTKTFNDVVGIINRVMAAFDVQAEKMKFPFLDEEEGKSIFDRFEPPPESFMESLDNSVIKIEKIKETTEDFGSSTSRAMGLALGGFANLAEAMGSKFETIARLQQLAAIANAYASASGAIAPPPVGYGATPMGFGMATAAVANGLANVIQIENSLKQMKAEKFETGGLIGGRRHSQGGTIIEAERGEFVMSRNAVSAIGVENLNRMNQGQSGGGSINISINGGMISPDFVENELAESIREAVRRGADFGIS